MTGRMIEEYKSESNRLSFGDKLFEGTYLVKVTSPSGQVRISKAIKVKK